MITNKNVKIKNKKGNDMKTKSGMTFEFVKTANKKILAIDAVLAK